MSDVREVRHKRLKVDGTDTFYREAGPENAPAILLPHGYPCSSYEFRELMPLLADEWRLLAPDFPGCGYSDTPAEFDYGFDGYARFLSSFATQVGAHRFALYLHDFGSQIGLRLAISEPDRIAALIIQNGDIYEDTLGPGYDPLKQFWSDPSPENRAKLGEAVSAQGFREEFLNDVEDGLGDLLPPDLWSLHWSLMTAERQRIATDVIAGLKDNLAWFPRYQAYLRERQPPTLIVWGPEDRYMPEASARAYLRDLPEAELHLLGGGHWLLETHLHEVVPLMRDFLLRVHGSCNDLARRRP